MKYRILTLALALCLVLVGCGKAEPKGPTVAENAPISLEELLGDWHLDGEYTQEKTGKTLEDIYGALWEEEDILQFSEDGRMYYKAGICYGNGTYNVTEKGVMVEFAGDEDEDDAGYNLLLVERSDKLRIVMDQYGDGTDVYWVKKYSETIGEGLDPPFSSEGERYEIQMADFDPDGLYAAQRLQSVHGRGDPSHGAADAASACHRACYPADDGAYHRACNRTHHRTPPAGGGCGGAGCFGSVEHRQPVHGG